MSGFLGNKSWSIDHSNVGKVEFDKSLQPPNVISQISTRFEEDIRQEKTYDLETALQKKLRKRSHWVAYTTMMIMTVGFSVVLSGVWPYLQSIEPSLSKESLGWVVAANPFGQMIASPFVGYIGNRIGSIRIICYITMSLYVTGNLLYSFLPALNDLWTKSGFHLMILSRFLVGISSSNVTLCRSYLASSTTTEERTKGVAIISAAQSLGFILGPTIQTILSLTIDNEMTKYRAAGWVAAMFGAINFILLTPCIFKEYYISVKSQGILESSADVGEKLIVPKPDYVALSGVLFGFFMNQFIYVLLETLMEPFLTDQYAWCDDIAVVVVGICFTCAGIIAIAMFTIAVKLAKSFDERKILLFCAFIPISLGVFLFIPWGPNELKYCKSTNTSDSIFVSQHQNMEIIQTRNINVSSWCDQNECLGCPAQQTWCQGYNQLAMPQFFVAFILVIIGYPFGVAMSNSIFSKMLGTRPQGFWMGILTASGSLSRVFGPIFVSFVYTFKGTTWTFSIILIGMFFAILELIILFKRIVPLKISMEQRNDKF